MHPGEPSSSQSGGNSSRVSFVLGRDSDGRRVHACRFCPYTAPYPNVVAKHMRSHTGEKPYRCHVCSRSFAHRSNLSRHLRIHTGEKRLVCPVCGASFVTKQQLTGHLAVHEGGHGGPFGCHLCAATFNSRTDLRGHYLRVHGQTYSARHGSKRASNNERSGRGFCK